MITETRPETPVEIAIRPGQEAAPIDFAELAAVGTALTALVLTVGLVKALVTGQPGLDAFDAVIVMSVWLLALHCWRSRARGPVAPR